MPAAFVPVMPAPRRNGSTKTRRSERGPAGKGRGSWQILVLGVAVVYSAGSVWYNAARIRAGSATRAQTDLSQKLAQSKDAIVPPQGPGLAAGTGRVSEPFSSAFALCYRWAKAYHVRAEQALDGMPENLHGEWREKGCWQMVKDFLHLHLEQVLHPRLAHRGSGGASVGAEGGRTGSAWAPGGQGRGAREVESTGSQLHRIMFRASKDEESHLMQSKVNPKIKILTVPAGSEAGRDFETRQFDPAPVQEQADGGMFAFAILGTGQESDSGTKKAHRGKIRPLSREPREHFALGAPAKEAPLLPLPPPTPPPLTIKVLAYNRPTALERLLKSLGVLLPAVS